ncbi:MAG: hypothetical protein ACI9TH_000737, partial [Kiritimatiellia bacterium]
EMLVVPVAGLAFGILLLFWGKTFRDGVKVSAVSALIL